MKEYIIKADKNLWQEIKSLPKHKDLFVTLTKKNVIAQYQRTYLGIIWLFLQPILMSFLFYNIIKFRSNISTKDYMIFLYSGFAIWTAFSGSLIGATNALIFNSNIIKKVYFPRMIIPISYISARLFDLSILFFSLILLILIKGVNISWFKFISFSILSIFILLIFTSGLGLFLSAINIRYRDLQRILPFFLRIILFTTPIIYPLNYIANPKIEFVLSLNPLTTSLNLIRAGIFNTHIYWLEIFTSVGISCVILLLSLLVFHYFEKTLTENL